MRRLTAAGALAGAALLAVTSSDAQLAPDPAARGLDLFIHVPDHAAPRGRLPLQVEAFGFPTVTTLVPLGGATVEAAWDPESLGPGISAAPPGASATTDASGRVHLDVPVPDGDVRALKLLVGLRKGGRERTQVVTIHRERDQDLSLHVADTRVVPGSSVSAWIELTSAATGDPQGGQQVELSLVEGGYTRHRAIVVTDAAGSAMTRIPIPKINEPAWSWVLSGRTLSKSEHDAARDSLTLTPREETPGTPSLFLRWAKSAVLTGDRITFKAEVRDATDQPVAALPVRYWIGPKGTEPPREEKEWLKVSTLAKTNGAGEVEGASTAPTTVVQGVGTTVRVVARTNVEGHDLEQSDTVAVGVPVSSATLMPEGGAIVPGLEQRMLLRVRDGRDRPVSGPFSVEADGLKASVTTDANGEAEVTWSPPADVGALRNVGPCAGGVAAAVTIRPTADIPALHPRLEPFQLCVSIDRDAAGLIRVDHPMAKVGDRVRVRIATPPAQKGKQAIEKRPWSVVIQSGNEEQHSSVWLEDGDKGAEITLPPAAGGAWTLSAVSPGNAGKAKVIGAQILVTPQILPKLDAKMGGGRLAPGGAVEIDADLTDGHGRGLSGTVSALVVDTHGGGSTRGLELLDTRHSICRGFGTALGLERCDGFVDGDPALDPLRRGLLGNQGVHALLPLNDPAANAQETLNKAFADVLLSLEGAIFEASQTAEQLRDVRRKGKGGWDFNPELMTLVTGAMATPPITPGGEPLGLGDLLAVDPQVTFNNVARRVTRLKLFRVLVAVRQFRHEKALDLDEPMFKNPNALLRRLVRDSRLGADLLLDPWGGTIQFIPSQGPPIPFLTAIRGFELHSPGPDGTVNTGDDVKDPFERVVRSGTPYAKAVGEDRIVDAKSDLEVGDATVEAWQSLFQELFGDKLGEAFGAGGLGLSGVGEGGGGRGEGIGLGSIGTIGHGAGTSAISTGVYFWSVPQRTDTNGHVRIHVPLGDVETTWRVALVGTPDGGRPATAAVDLPVALPLSARVDVGAKWVEKDWVTASVTLRNRTDQPIRATLDAAPGGVAKLRNPREASRTVEVPAGGATVEKVALSAPSAGEGSLTVTVRAPGLPDDVLTHTWQVIEPGEPTDLTRSQWVTQDVPGDLQTAIDPQAMRLFKAPRLVLERGYEEALRAALEALDPDRLRSNGALVDAIEVAARIERWAIGREGESSALALRAGEMQRRALGRLSMYKAGSGMSWAATARMAAWSPVKEKPATPVPSESKCPIGSGVGSLEETVYGLDAEPGPVGGAALTCWDAYVSNVVDELQHTPNPVLLAQAVLALSERPHRAATATALMDRLRERVQLRGSGGIALDDWAASSRASRAIVFSALLRGVRLGRPSIASPERLYAWIAVQRDVDGGYGSPLATRSVVRALLSSGIDLPGKTVVKVTAAGTTQTVTVGQSQRVLVSLPANVMGVNVEVEGPGVIARFERPVLRLWSKPPEELSSPVHVQVEWPSEARAGRTGVLRLTARHGLGRSATMDVRVPLPPGVSLAEAVQGVQQVQGVLWVRRSVDASDLPTVIEIPVRFALSGVVTAPEVRASIAYEEVQRAIAPARPLWIK